MCMSHCSNKEWGRNMLALLLGFLLGFINIELGLAKGNHHQADRP